MLCWQYEIFMHQTNTRFVGPCSHAFLLLVLKSKLQNVNQAVVVIQKV